MTQEAIFDASRFDEDTAIFGGWLGAREAVGLSQAELAWVFWRAKTRTIKGWENDQSTPLCEQAANGGRAFERTTPRIRHRRVRAHGGSTRVAKEILAEMCKLWVERMQVIEERDRLSQHLRRILAGAP